MNWIVIISGVALLVAPFVFGYSGMPMALWTSLIMGVVITFLGFKQFYKWAAGMGILTFIAPWILCFSGVGAALWSCLILGGAVALLAGYRGFFGQEKSEVGGMQHRNA